MKKFEHEQRMTKELLETGQFLTDDYFLIMKSKKNTRRYQRQVFPGNHRMEPETQRKTCGRWIHALY